MLKFLVSLFTLFVITTSAPTNNIRFIDGIVEGSDAEYTYIATSDGNGWVIDVCDTLTINEDVIIVFDNMNTESIYDDEIILIIGGDK